MAQHHVKRRKLSHDSIRNGNVGATNLSKDSASETAFSESPQIEPAPTKGKANLQHGSSSSKIRSRGQTDDLLLASSSSYKSSLLKIQLDELLSEVSVDHEERLSLCQSTVRRLKDIIKNLVPKKPMYVQDAEKSLRKSAGIEIPFPEPRPGKEAKYEFAFSPPSAIDVVEELGQVQSDGTMTIDLAAQIPGELFQEKDYLNYRYFHKRAYYIACIAAGIQAFAKGEFLLSYGFQCGNMLLPTLLAKPGDQTPQGEMPRFCIHIITDLPADIFPTKRTLPFLNCVRPKTSERPEADIDRSPTPFYNGTLRSEATNRSYRQLFQSTATICDSFRDFCVLGQVWLRQRGFDQTVQANGFGGWEWALCCALLIEDNGGAKSMFSRYTSYQLFKTMLQFLGTKDLTTPVLLNGEGIQFPKTNQPVLYDCGRDFNVLYKMQRWSYEYLKYEALVTLKALNNRQRDYFDATFIARVNEPSLKYDRLLEIDISTLCQPSISQIAFLDKVNELYEVLIRGLGDRVRVISLSFSEPQGHPLSKKEKVDLLSSSHLRVGIILDPENAERIVDRGPSPEEKEEIADFRKFWGDKAELRRFRDGTISESLVWMPDSREPVICQIIRLLLHRHFQLEAQSIDLGVHSAQASTLHDLDMSLGHEAFRPLDTAFESLSTEINQLEGLPLSIRSIVAADPAIRYSLLRTPSKITPSKIDIVLQFEGSTRWPDNLLAIQRTKVAFLIKLGELLESSVQNTTARVGLENQSTPLQNQAFLDIALHATVNFRLRIHHDREELLLSRDLKSKEVGSLRRESASQALLAYKRTFIHSPSHTQSLRALCIRHPSLPAAIRLLKKWISSHLLTRFLPQPLVELLAVSVYTDPYPWDTPTTPLTAFLRTLNLLSKWSWPSSPLIVDLNPSSSSSTSSPSLTSADLQTIHTNFTAWRKLDPDMNTVSLFVASSIDDSGVAWTQNAHPPKVVAARLSSLASAAVEVIKSSGLGLTVGRLFNTPMGDYDFLIHLGERFTRAGVERRKEKMDQKYKNLQAGSAAFDYKEIVDLFIADAARVLGENALLFYGEDGEPVIAGLWNPRSLTKRQWRVRMGFSAKVAVGEGEQVAMNTEGMLAEVALIGEGIVKRIEIVHKKDT